MSEKVTLRLSSGYIVERVIVSSVFCLCQVNILRHTGGMKIQKVYDGVNEGWERLGEVVGWGKKEWEIPRPQITAFIHVIGSPRQRVPRA